MVGLLTKINFRTLKFSSLGHVMDVWSFFVQNYGLIMNIACQFFSMVFPFEINAKYFYPNIISIPSILNAYDRGDDSSHEEKKLKDEILS